MDVEKVIVSEFVASTYESINNQLGIFHNRVRNVEFMEEMGKLEKDEMWGYQRNLEQALRTVYDEVRTAFGHTGTFIEALKKFNRIVTTGLFSTAIPLEW